MREIVLDVETTGLDPSQGHRIVELGCIELLNQIPTGSTFHVYLNPDRDMPAEAFAVHGLSTEFLKQHKRFIEVADEFLAFIGDAPLVIHNAGFDHGFICAELNESSVRWSQENASSILCCWRVASIPPDPTGLMTYVRDMESIVRGVPNTAHCLTPKFWPRFMSN